MKVLTKMMRPYFEASLILRVTLALVLGLAVGFLGGDTAADWLAPLGDLLLRLLQFLIVPIVLFTLVSGINQIESGRAGRMGGKVLLYYVISTALAMMVGLAVASVLQPGEGMVLGDGAQVSVPDNPGFFHVLLSIVPANIVEAMAGPNLLGIIFTAVVFGLALLELRRSETHGALAERLYQGVEGLNVLTLKVMDGVLHYVPIGVFAIVAETVGKQGVSTLLSLGDMILVLYVALALQLVVYGILMAGFGVRVGAFFKAARTPMATAFATQSSSGTLPLTLDAARRLSLPQGLYGFSLPLGATINMDGAAIRIAVSAVFAANVMGVPLSLSQMVDIVLLGTLISVGTAGVPGAGIVMIATVFTQVGLPIETVALLTSIDALVGMGCTAINVTGDLAGTALIATTEQQDNAEVTATS
ncbi:dicarboxylate/amino acid:cation symporter [Larsenimonas rhizosphaerae]|uniref:Dicarboxylate/amino acid:cation symporter n=1 Tax=Larsenimonas rhizosphaerae TaxID=2944682 RepID=A0AA41ZEN7_9GAMM|nr:dicarboxylate/amino acid:cation symporter [Larsenimonas rhizosphaerae]MCX2522764.1 dicarboxylate/amino acid:cation symporter [Larsenimonas rhizosphaerae]